MIQVITVAPDGRIKENTVIESEPHELDSSNRHTIFHRMHGGMNTLFDDVATFINSQVVSRKLAITASDLRIRKESLADSISRGVPHRFGASDLPSGDVHYSPDAIIVSFVN